MTKNNMKSKPSFSTRGLSKKKASTVARRRGATGNGITGLARLLNDPCAAPLVAPQYGASSGGYLTKLAKFDQVDMSVGGNGYIVWFPDYTGRNGAGQKANCFVYQSTGLGAPVNTDALPFGSGTANSADTQGWTASDPAYNFVNSTTVQDSRTVAACIKMLYTGRNDALAGRVGVISGFSRDALLNGGGGAPPTITEMFNYCSDVSRTPMDHVELKFKPSEGSEYYRNVTNIEDVAFNVGSLGGSATVIGAGTPGSVGTGIGFCWSGLDDTSTLTFDFLKAIEWRPEFATQLVAPPQSVAQSGGNMVSRAVAYLDAHFPGWHQTLTNAGTSAAARIAQTAFTGPMNQLIKAAPLMLL